MPFCDSQFLKAQTNCFGIVTGCSLSGALRKLDLGGDSRSFLLGYTNCVLCKNAINSISHVFNMSCVSSHVFHISHDFRVSVRLGFDLRLDYMIGETTHPCHSPELTENQSDRFPSTVTLDWNWSFPLNLISCAMQTACLVKMRLILLFYLLSFSDINVN